MLFKLEQISQFLAEFCDLLVTLFFNLEILNDMFQFRTWINVVEELALNTTTTISSSSSSSADTSVTSVDGEVDTSTVGADCAS